MSEGTQTRPAAAQTAKQARMGTRVVLLAGFGGLLVLMATASADSLQVLRQVQTSNAQIHRDFMVRQGTLEQIRAALYLSGTLVRDYILLDPGQNATETLRAELRKTRAEMDAALESYSRSLRPDEKVSLQNLTSELETYWSVLDPILEWDPQQKRERGYWFLRQEVFPRRTIVLHIAQNIAAVNERTLNEGEKRMGEVFARFRRRMQVITWVGLGLGLLVAVMSIIHILRLEKNADLRYQESVRAQRELKELSARLVDAQEQERRSISRELHDEVGQSLSALLMDVGNLTAAQPGIPAFQQHLESIKRLAENSVNAVRNMALLLRPSMLDDLGLVAALQWQTREVSKRTGMRVELVEENVSDDLPEDYKTCMYRVVQEALNNCARHAEATGVRVVMRQEPERLLLTIEDDGKGFDARRVRGLGLVGMAERVAHLGGAFRVESQPGHGASLWIELPLAGQPASSGMGAT